MNSSFSRKQTDQQQPIDLSKYGPHWSSQKRPSDELHDPDTPLDLSCKHHSSQISQAQSSSLLSTLPDQGGHQQPMLIPGEFQPHTTQAPTTTTAPGASGSLFDKKTWWTVLPPECLQFSSSVGHPTLKPEVARPWHAWFQNYRHTAFATDHEFLGWVGGFVSAAQRRIGKRGENSPGNTTLNLPKPNPAFTDNQVKAVFWGLPIDDTEHRLRNECRAKARAFLLTTDQPEYAAMKTVLQAMNHLRRNSYRSDRMLFKALAQMADLKIATSTFYNYYSTIGSTLDLPDDDPSRKAGESLKQILEDTDPNSQARKKWGADFNALHTYIANA